MRKICINCAPLSGDITGIERCIYENIRRIDVLASHDKIVIELLYPAGIKMNFPQLSCLPKIPLKARGNKIDIFALRKYVKDNNAVYFSLHGGLCLVSEAVICINDMRTWKHREYDPFSFRLKCNINALTAKIWEAKIVTISQTARKEISSNLKIKEEAIDVIYPGWEHIFDTESDYSIWNRLSEVRKGEYFYSLSSRAPHKNFKWIEEVAKRNPDCLFLIGGKQWTNNQENSQLKNVIYLGYISDAENIELMKNCKAFLHPSKYEGFGMTPLEACACGAQICVSNASCLPEIFGNCAHYFDPDNYEINLKELLLEQCASADQLLDKYSWEKSSQKWFDLMKKCAGEES